VQRKSVCILGSEDETVMFDLGRRGLTVRCGWVGLWCDVAMSTCLSIGHASWLIGICGLAIISTSYAKLFLNSKLIILTQN
jgi:hypothetical protein